MMGTQAQRLMGTMTMLMAVGRQFRLIRPGADGDVVERLLPEQSSERARKKKS
ncbi:hypothetical protein C8J43_11624 [Sphingomonas sp. PP-CE-1G-424]|nr:hypothetical protein C8J43_11624 [Sphingomonas sp. PP-CE-1G-424]